MAAIQVKDLEKLVTSKMNELSEKIDKLNMICMQKFKEIDDKVVKISLIDEKINNLIVIQTPLVAREEIAQNIDINVKTVKHNIIETWKQEVANEKIESGKLGKYKTIVFDFVNSIDKSNADEIKQYKTVIQKGGILTDYNAWKEEDWKSIANKFWSKNMSADKYKGNTSLEELRSEIEGKKNSVKSSGVQLDST